jgi:hypothetical protein
MQPLDILPSMPFIEPIVTDSYLDIPFLSPTLNYRTLALPAWVREQPG